MPNTDEKPSIRDEKVKQSIMDERIHKLVMDEFAGKIVQAEGHRLVIALLHEAAHLAAEGGCPLSTFVGMSAGQFEHAQGTKETRTARAELGCPYGPPVPA